MAAEIGPNDNEAGTAIRRANKLLVERSGGLLPPVDVDVLKIASAGATHTNQILRLADASATVQIPMVTGCEELCHNGYVSQQRILERCPSLKTPMRVGMKWWVARWQICELCPTLMPTISEAANSDHDSFQHETPMQIMFNIQRRAVSLQADDDEKWGKVVTLVARGHDVKFQSTVEHYMSWVKNYSSDDSNAPVFLHEINRFDKSLRTKRDIPSKFLKDLSAVQLPQAPLYLVGLVKATLCAPEKFMIQGEPRVFNADDLKSILSSNKSRAMQAHDYMQSVRVISAK